MATDNNSIETDVPEIQEAPEVPEVKVRRTRGKGSNLLRIQHTSQIIGERNDQ